MNMLKTAVLTLLLLLAVLSVYAEPQLSVAAVDSISIPYPYDYSMMLPNGDIQFYKITYGASSIQIYGFQYLAESHQITTQVNLGTVSGLGGLNTFTHSVLRFNKLYLIYDVAGGIAIMILDQNTLTSRVICDFTVYDYFSRSSRLDIVAEDAIVLAVDRLVYYNIIDGTYRTLLEGQEYYNPNMDLMRVLFLPGNHFVYVKDVVYGSDNPEVWTIFDSEGNYLFTQTYVDYVMNMSTVGPLADGPEMVHDRFYISHPAIVEMGGGNLECYFVEPDSLHLYSFFNPYSEYETDFGFFPFGDDRTLVLSHDAGSIDAYYLTCYNSPLELNHVPTYTFSFGMHQPIVNCISSDIVTMSAKLTQSIAIAALWTHDYPNVHEFYFPASSNAPTSCITYNYDNSLYIINNSKVYRFHVGVSSPNDDVVAVIPEYDLQVYPNPVRIDQSLTIRSQSKRPSKIDIYNIKGQRVQTLQMNESGQLDWNLSSSTNPKLSTGVYFIKQRDANHTKPKRFVLIK